MWRPDLSSGLMNNFVQGPGTNHFITLNHLSYLQNEKVNCRVLKLLILMGSGPHFHETSVKSHSLSLCPHRGKDQGARWSFLLLSQAELSFINSPLPLEFCDTQSFEETSYSPSFCSQLTDDTVTVALWWHELLFKVRTISIHLFLFST